MSASLHLARPDDLERLDALVAAFHDEQGITLSDEARRAGLQPLLDGSPHGAAYLIGLARSPIGYIVISFGWSVEFGGMDGFVDEIYLRRAVRGRGIASEVLATLPVALADAGLKALHLEVDRDDARSRKLYARVGFRDRERSMLMNRRF